MIHIFFQLILRFKILSMRQIFVTGVLVIYCPWLISFLNWGETWCGKKWTIYHEPQKYGQPTKNGCDQLFYTNSDTEEKIRALTGMAGVHGWWSLLPMSLHQWNQINLPTTIENPLTDVGVFKKLICVRRVSSFLVKLKVYWKSVFSWSEIHHALILQNVFLEPSCILQLFNKKKFLREKKKDQKISILRHLCEKEGELKSMRDTQRFGSYR